MTIRANLEALDRRKRERFPTGGYMDRHPSVRPAYRPSKPRLSVPRKLDPWKVKAMRTMYDKGEKITVIAAEHGVCDTTAWKVCTRVTWRHVG